MPYFFIKKGKNNAIKTQINHSINDIAMRTKTKKNRSIIVHNIVDNKAYKKTIRKNRKK